MNIEIGYREVLQNLVRFKESLADLPAHGGGSVPRQRIYRMLVHRTTGEMNFAKTLRSLEGWSASGQQKGTLTDWSEVWLIVAEDEKGVLFSLQSPQGGALHTEEFAPLAWEISKETVAVLNQKAQEEHPHSAKLLAEELLLQDLRPIRWNPQGFDVRQAPGWVGKIGKIEAEKRLLSRPIGTFLLREADPLTYEMAQRLAEENHSSAQPVILAIKEAIDEVKEYLLFRTPKGWVLYSDDPRLPSYPLYSSLQTLFFADPLKGKALYPI